MTEPVSGLKPLYDCILVELKQSLKNVHIKQGKYDTHTEGVVIETRKIITKTDKKGRIEHSITATELDWLIGKRVFFEEFKEGSQIKRNGKLYSFIKIEDIRGYEENAETD